MVSANFARRLVSQKPWRRPSAGPPTTRTLNPVGKLSLVVMFVACAQWRSARAPADEWDIFSPLPERLPRLPIVDQVASIENPIDAFVESRLRRAGLQQAPSVDRRTWIRRVTYDLIGLPPTPEEVAQLVADPRDDSVAYADVVDRLLASPRYGERWARHWLDVVRYADTDGFAIDKERPTLWRYRDYVVRAYNDDLPYDQFLREQLAGDELDLGPLGLVATGFWRLGPWEADNMVAENRWQDYLNDVTSTIGTAMLGLTVGCARCHDHKFDPIPQNDFYRLQAFLAPVQHESLPAAFLSVERLPGKEIAEKRMEELRSAWLAYRQELKGLIAKAAGKTDATISDQELDDALGQQGPISKEQRKRHDELKSAVDKFHDVDRFAATACSIANLEPEKVPKTFVLLNGDVFAPGEEVEPGFLSAISIEDESCSQQLESAGGMARGRRRLLADWICAPQNPLTARVYVNRIWQYHFGQGLCATANDFGQNGAKVTHPDLLDYLARWFIDGGWQVKRLHRLMVLSITYRSLTTHPDRDACLAVDPENSLLWEARLRRLESEAIRDALLAVAGRLNLTMGGPGFFEALPDEMETSYSFFDWNASPDADRARRSIYMFQRRNLVHPFVEVFDGADLNQSCDRRRHSVTAPQVLTLMNSKLAQEASRGLARRLMIETDAGTSRIDRLFQLSLSRSPTAGEETQCAEFLQTRSDAYGSASDPQFEGLVDLCRAILNTSEFLYLD
jgi:hypothetical protein